MHKAIMVPLDGSRFGEEALPIAVRLAKDLDRSIELVSVFEDEPPVATWVLTAAEMRSLLDEYLETLGNQIRESACVEVTRSVLSGPVTMSLEAHAKEKDPELIVMSTHGRGAVSRAWLGSVADHVTRHVSMPVLLVRPDEDPGEVQFEGSPPFEHVLVPLDGSDRAEASLAWSTRIALAHKSKLTVLSVVPPPPVLTSPYLPDVIAESKEGLEKGQREAEQYLNDIAVRLEKEGVSIGTVVRVGIAPASGINRYALDHGVDLIVISTHGRGGLPRLLLGSVADKVVRGATAPVLVTRPRG